MASGSFVRVAYVLSSGIALAGCSGHTGASSAEDAGPPPLQAAIGPIDVPAGVETTQCIVMPLGNTEDVVVDSLTIDLSAGSHHLIVYMTSDAVQSDPVNCIPFAGIATGSDTPLVFANKQHETWTFPSGVAQLVPANQNVRVEGHYINATAQDLQGTGTVTFQTTPASVAPPFQQANFVFYGTSQISIPPNASFETPQNFQAGIAGTHFISVTTHEHRLGTDAVVWASAQPGDVSNQIANDTDWSNPSWNLLPTQFDFDGTSGLTYQCSWFNNTTATVGFGESALNEMCFIGGYYYPATVLDLCVDGQCKNR
jgi:Copper type II ascorbate-dependent monooxygenase, C-terminal domain